MNIFAEGKHDDNWRVLDQLLERMSWKESRKIAVVTPPIAIASEMRGVMESPIIGECISPVAGRVRKVVIRAELIKPETAILKIEIEGLSSATSNLFEVNGNVFVYKADIEVSEGALIRVSVVNQGIVARAGFSCLIDLKAQDALTLPMEYPAMEE